MSGPAYTLGLNGPVALDSVGTGTGTVTSVAMTGDGVVYNASVSGSPVTTSGTLAPSLATHAKNTVLSGPTTGADAPPTFRALVEADIPSFVDSFDIALSWISVVGGVDSPLILMASARYPFTINAVSGLVSLSTQDLSFQINGVDITGMASLTATTTPVDYTATANNSVSVGDQVRIVNGSPFANSIAGTIKITRAF